MMTQDGKPLERLGIVRCPAHDDTIPSLWIGRSVDGYLAMKCLAGCDDRRVRLNLNAERRGDRNGSSTMEQT